MSVSPPRPKMPSLNALRAFEAVARLGSIAAAAGELCVTPAAVAQHLKSLEAWAGNSLLKRHARGVSLTPLGAGVFADFELAFDQLGMAVQKLRTNASPHEIRIAALPCVAQLWLSPRLPEIRAAMPEVSISVSALEKCPNLAREPFDLAIFYRGHEATEPATIINQDVIYPVAAPALASKIHSIYDLADEVFLHDMSWKSDWQTWLSQVSPNENLNKSGPEFTLYALALEECKNGAGILMGHEDLVRRQIDNGEVVAIFDDSVGLERDLVVTTPTQISPGSIIDILVTKLLAKN